MVSELKQSLHLKKILKKSDFLESHIIIADILWLRN